MIARRCCAGLQQAQHRCCATTSARWPALRSLKARRAAVCKAAAREEPVQEGLSPGQEVCSTGSRILQQDGHQLAQLLRQLCDLQVRPHQQWLQDALDTLEPQLMALAPTELSSCLQVLGQWGFTASKSFMQQFHAAAQQHLQHKQLSSRNIASMVWALAQLNNPQQPLLEELLQAAGSMLAADVHRGQQLQQQTCDPQLPSSLADLVWAVAKLQHHPGDRWMDNFCRVAQPLLKRFTPHQLAQTIWACARLQPNWQPDEAFLQAFYAAVQANLADFDSSSISLSAWGLATLKAKPSTRFLFCFERQAECTLGNLQAAELACTLWALSELKQKRPDQLRLGRLVRRQEVFHSYDHQLLTNLRLLRVVRSLTLGPKGGGARGSNS